MNRVLITPGGRLGNQMIQFMVAKTLQRLVPDAAIYGYDMPDWHLSAPLPEDVQMGFPALGGLMFDIHHVAERMNAGKTNGVRIKGLGFEMENLGSRETNGKYFVLEGDSSTGFGESDLVINVRGEEILVPGRHPDYGPLPIHFYRALVRQTGLNPVFMGQIEEGRYADAILKAFPGARIIPSRGVINDFQTIRKSRNIVVSLSTYSWIAAWLSDAVKIHLPLFGFYNPLQQPEINCLPVDDGRYEFYSFPVRRWRASSSQIEALYDDSIRFEKIGSEDVRRKLNWAAWRTAGKRLLKRRRFDCQCLLARSRFGGRGG